MTYGPIPQRKLPLQNTERLMRLGERFQRSAGAHSKWAEGARRAVDFVEGKQWTDAEIQELRAKRRPHMVFNKTGRLVRLLTGYHRSNRTDITFRPGDDGLSSEDTAEVLSMMAKSIATNSDLDYVDADVFQDGIVTGRGFYDERLDFTDNDFGDVRIAAVDPFSVYLDPDADGYDLNDANMVFVTRWTSPDELAFQYGREAYDLIAPLARGSTPAGPVFSWYGPDGEITPERNFGLSEDDAPEWWNSIETVLGDWVDPLRQNVRVIDCQYKVTEPRRVFIDLETGDRKVVPPHWNSDRIAKVLYHAERVGNPLIVQVRPVRLIRWTTLVGDLIVWDDWSPYAQYTLNGYFPYFRRGKTRGVVEDLIDPQIQINKMRSNRTDILNKTANGGWKYEEDSLDPEQEANLRRYGSTPGVNIKYRKGASAPEQIRPFEGGTGYRLLEESAEDDLNDISGLNEAALGEVDKVMSGRAMEARQRQAVLAVQMYMDNFQRTKRQQGKRLLHLIQNHYTEERFFRVAGEDGALVQKFINQALVDPNTGTRRILNDVTVGKYAVVIDETPLAATFANAQFEEAMAMMEKMGGALPPQAIVDIIVDLSSLPRKDEIKDRVRGMMGMGPPAGPGAPPGPGGPTSPTSIVEGAAPGDKVVRLAPTGGAAPVT